MKKPTLTVTGDKVGKLSELMKSLKNDRVLVGIPQDESSRDVAAGEAQEKQMSNAALLFMNNFGSPANNIPARPVMSIGLRLAGDRIARQLAKAVQDPLGDPAAVSVAYERAGIVASNAIKKVIDDQTGILAPAKATISRREYSGFLGTKALVVTGQMRNAITYVVKEGK